MVRLMFENYLQDDDEYQACERYWYNMVSEIANSLGQADEWKQWVSHYYADGSTLIEKEFNPICSSRSNRLNRAFIIYQKPAISDTIEIGAWIKTYNEENWDTMSRAILTINLSLSEEAAEVARKLLFKWMSQDTTVNDMRSYIRENLPWFVD